MNRITQQTHKNASANINTGRSLVPPRTSRCGAVLACRQLRAAANCATIESWKWPFVARIPRSLSSDSLR